MRSIKPANLDQTTIIECGSCAQTDHLHPHLIIFSGNNSGRRHKLRRGTTTIGRSPRTDISINDDRVSRVHCIIEWMGDTITIEDKVRPLHNLLPIFDFYLSVRSIICLHLSSNIKITD
jgi:pSer/pThr/pTyr-binding forkhead associated (FHA) protein